MRRLCVAALVGLLVAACSGGSTSGSDEDSGLTSPDPSATMAPGTTVGLPATQGSPPPAVEYLPVDLDAAIAQLDDASTRVNGVIGILDALGIGVYGANGAQVLAGSETGPDDLWVMSELLPGLAAATTRPGPTMERYLATLESALGTGLEPAELAAAYDVMVESLPEFGMSRVIRALDIHFSPGERLTRFEAWLLYLAWLEPNGATEVAALSAGPILGMATPVFLARDVRCGPTGAGGNDPGYSLADQYGKTAADEAGGQIQDAIADGALGLWEGTSGSAARVAGVLKNIGAWVIKPITTMADAVSALQVALNFDIAVDASPISVHEVHDGDGETKESNRAEVTITVTFLGVTAGNEEGCEVMSRLGLPDPNTPIRGAQVEFAIDEKLAEHGTVRRRQDQLSARASTDEKGQVVVWYEPDFERPESAQSLGDPFLHKVQGTYTVTATVTAAMGQLFNVFSGWEFALDLLGLNEIDGEITVGWHDPAAAITISEPMAGWDGIWTLRLETCDGVNWEGDIVASGTMQQGGGTLTLVTDSGIAVIMQEGASTGTSPILVDSTMSGTVEDATITNVMAQAGNLTLSIGEDGTAEVTMAMDAGTQDITVSTPDGSVTQAAATDAYTDSWTAPVQPHSCDE